MICGTWHELSCRLVTSESPRMPSPQNSSEIRFCRESDNFERFRIRPATGYAREISRRGLTARRLRRGPSMDARIAQCWLARTYSTCQEGPPKRSAQTGRWLPRFSGAGFEHEPRPLSIPNPKGLHHVGCGKHSKVGAREIGDLRSVGVRGREAGAQQTVGGIPFGHRALQSGRSGADGAPGGHALLTTATTGPVVLQFGDSADDGGERLDTIVGLRHPALQNGAGGERFERQRGPKGYDHDGSLKCVLRGRSGRPVGRPVAATQERGPACTPRRGVGCRRSDAAASRAASAALGSPETAPLAGGLLYTEECFCQTNPFKKCVSIVE